MPSSASFCSVNIHLNRYFDKSNERGSRFMKPSTTVFSRLRRSTKSSNCYFERVVVLPSWHYGHFLHSVPKKDSSVYSTRIHTIIDFSTVNRQTLFGSAVNVLIWHKKSTVTHTFHLINSDLYVFTIIA